MSSESSSFSAKTAPLDPSNASLKNGEVETSIALEETANESQENLAAAALKPAQEITTLQENDVISGRGSGPNEFIGNQKFRDLVDARRREYNLAKSHGQKTQVAERVFQEICSRGGRFLSRIDKADSFVIEDGVWQEMTEDAAVEKCKQGLRQRRKAKGRIRKATSMEAGSSFAGNIAGMLPGNPVMTFGQQHVLHHQQSLPILPPMVVGSGAPPLDATRRLSLYQNGPLYPGGFLNGTILPDINPPTFNMQSPYDAIQRGGLPLHVMSQVAPPQVHASAAAAPLPFYVENSALHYRFRDVFPLQPTSDSIPSDSTFRGNGLVRRNNETMEQQQSAAAEVASSVWEEDSCQWAPDDEVSDFFIASLGWGANPRFTEEEFQRELASRTNEEKASILADLFGKFCSVVDDHQNKRARKDLDEQSIQFLIDQMKLEIEKLPENKKAALVEAQKKARAEEFSDERFEQFLRCEGMNPKVSNNIFGPS